MKKLLAFIIAMFACTSAFDAVTISRTAVVSWDDLTIAKYNLDHDTAYTKVNSGIYSDNIVNGTISHEDMNINAKGSAYEYETLGEFVYTGITLPSSGSRTDATITSGTAYIQGLRIVKAATTHTFGASKTTWVFLNSNEEYSYVESATQPSTPANSITLGVS